MHCPDSNDGFLPVWFGMVTVLFIVWPRSLLLGPFHKKTENLREAFGFCRSDNPQFSFIMYCYTYRRLTCRNLEVSEFSFLRKSTKTKRKSLVIRTFDFIRTSRGRVSIYSYV